MFLKEDEIVSIEYIGEEETADIKIIDADGEHQCNYFANDFNVHNSGAMAKYPSLKHGKLKRKKLHKIVDDITDDTYGLPIYQEQVMMIARELGGFNWAQTNEIRKVMSKSAGAEYFERTFWESFKEGAAVHDVDEKLARTIFREIMTFGSWGFNLAHAVSYAFVSYFGMWFKVHYPIEYCAAFLNKVSGGATRDLKLKQMIKEVERLGILLKEPDINISKFDFVIDGDSIIAGLSNIKNVGDKAVETIIDGQPYSNFVDFLKRINKRACNKRSVENLIKAGAFSQAFSYDVFRLLEVLPDILSNVKKGTEKCEKVAYSLLSECKGKEQYTDTDLAKLKQSVSPISVGKHISEHYQHIVDNFAPHVKVTKLIDIVQDEEKQLRKGKDVKRLDVWIMGLFGKPDLKRLSQEVKEVISKGNEQRYALANLQDETDFIVLSFRNETYIEYEQSLFDFKDKVILINGTINEGWKKCYVERLWVMDDVLKYWNDSRKPFNFKLDYLFEHPIKRIFDKHGGPDVMHEKFKCHPISIIKRVLPNQDVWLLGIISHIHVFHVTNIRSKMVNEKFYAVYFEDETFTGCFMMFPNDKRFEEIMTDAFMYFENHMPFLLRVRRSLDFKKEDFGYKKSNMVLVKDKEWKDLIHTPFKRK